MAAVFPRPISLPAVSYIVLCLLIPGTACSTSGSDENVASSATDEQRAAVSQIDFPQSQGDAREYAFGSVQEMAKASDLVIVGEVVSAGPGSPDDAVVFAEAENQEDERRIAAHTTIFRETVIKIVDVLRGSVNAEFVVSQEDGYIRGSGYSMGTFWAYEGQTVGVFAVETGSTRIIEGAAAPVVQLVTTQGRFFVDEAGQLAHNFLYRPRIDSRDDNQIRLDADGSIDWSGVPRELRPDGFTPERLRNLVFEFDEVAHALGYDDEVMREPKISLAALMASRFTLDTMVETIEAL